MELHVNWGRASAQQLKRVLVDSDRKNTHLITCADEILAQCEVCQAFDKAPRSPAAGTSITATSNEKLPADLLFLRDIIALHVMDVFAKYSPLIPFRTTYSQEVWDAFCRSWIAVFGPFMGIQVDEGGEWQNELWPELRSERRIKLLFQ